MGLGLEIMIMVALVVFILTGMISIGITMWYIKAFGPILKLMMKQYTRMLGELDEDEEVKLERIK